MNTLNPIVTTVLTVLTTPKSPSSFTLEELVEMPESILDALIDGVLDGLTGDCKPAEVLFNASPTVDDLIGYYKGFILGYHHFACHTYTIEPLLPVIMKGVYDGEEGVILNNATLYARYTKFADLEVYRLGYLEGSRSRGRKL